MTRTWMPALVPWLAAAVGGLATIVTLYPGQYPFDSAYQLWEARTGQITNGSPVAMIALWSLLLDVTGNPASLFCLDVAMLWVGLALAASAISGSAWGRVALPFVLGMGPLALAQMAHVLTDAHLAAVLVLATGLAAWGLTAGRRVPLLACVALLVYAGCTRHNAVLAIPPYGALAAAAFAPRDTRRSLATLLGGAALAALSLAIAFALDRALVTQRESVWPTIALWDLAAISVDRNELVLPPFTHGPGMTAEELRATGAFDRTANVFLFEKSRSGMRDGLAYPFSKEELRELRDSWIRAVLENPGAYARHRLRTFWLLIGPHRGDVQGVAYFERRDRYRDNPPFPAAVSAAAQDGFYRLAAAARESWIFAALPYLLCSVAASIVAWKRRERATARVALAVSGSALLYAAGFLPLAPAADLRYLTWPMIAGPLALAFALSRRTRQAPPMQPDRFVDARPAQRPAAGGDRGAGARGHEGAR